MRYEIVLAPQAIDDLKRLKASARADVKDSIERHLRNEPTKLSKSRIKRLRGLSQPQCRLRVGEIRVFYDVGPGLVEVLAIISKPEAQSWLARTGKPE